MTSPVLLDVVDGVATLTLNRPDALNALSFEMMEALSEATAQLSRRDDLRVVVVTGAGNHFMAGGDLKDFAGQLHLSPESRIATFRATIEQHINRSVEAFAALRVPVIARVHGACAGFGLSLAMGCDMVVAADTAYFTTAYSSIALSGDGGVSWFLPRIVGRSKAFELLLLADRFDAAEALRLGIVNKVVPLAELDDAVAKLVGRFLRGPRDTYAEMKRLLGQSPDQSLDVQLQLEAEAFARCAARPDFDEGVNAFFEKRKARFNGRGDTPEDPAIRGRHSRRRGGENRSSPRPRRRARDSLALRPARIPMPLRCANRSDSSGRAALSQHPRAQKGGEGVPARPL